MVTLVVFEDGTVHHDNPDKKQETFCGEEWSHNHENVTTVASFAFNVDYAVSEVIANNESAEHNCEECQKLGEKWALPYE